MQLIISKFCVKRHGRCANFHSYKDSDGVLSPAVSFLQHLETKVLGERSTFLSYNYSIRFSVSLAIHKP